MARIRKNERLLNLVSVLLKAGRPVPWSAIRRDVVGYNSADDSKDTAERRFERDKADLRAMGVPLEYASSDEHDREGYSIPPGSYFLPELDLNPEEVLTLAFIARAAERRTAGPLGEALQSAVQKLQFDAPIPGDVRATVEERFLFHHPAESESAPGRERLEALSDGVLRAHTVRFRYRAAGGGEMETRSVDPYGLAHWRGHWYLVGRAHDRDAIRSFRVDRIDGAVLTPHAGRGADFEVPPDFRLQDYVGRMPWELAGAAPAAVTIRFDPVVAWMVKETRQGRGEWRDEADGGGTLECSVGDVDALLRWVLRFGVHAELLQPTELRERLAAMLDKIEAMYAEGKGGA